MLATAQSTLEHWLPIWTRISEIEGGQLTKGWEQLTQDLVRWSLVKSWPRQGFSATGIAFKVLHLKFAVRYAFLMRGKCIYCTPISIVRDMHVLKGINMPRVQLKIKKMFSTFLNKTRTPDGF